MDGRNPRTARGRSHALKAARTSEGREAIVNLLGDAIARVIEGKGHADLCDMRALSDSSVARVEMPGHAGLSVVADVGSPSEASEPGVA